LNEFFFFYGTLCHGPLRDAVLGACLPVQPAHWSGHALAEACAGGQPLGFPLPVAAPAGALSGVLLALSPDQAARLAYYEAGYRRRRETVLGPEGPQEAWVFHPEPGRWQPGGAWDFARWQAAQGALATAAAAEFLRGFGTVAPEAALARYPQMLVRAASKLRAETAPPAMAPRRDVAAGDVEIVSSSTGYAHFFAVEDYRLRHATFAGGQSATLERAVFVSGDAACVLPYDPLRDRVLVIEQFRPGPMARGEANPWMLEPIAGRVDPFETPEQAVRREAGEEAGLTVGRLIAAPAYYPTPGAKSEFIYNFIGLTDLPDGAGRPGGVAEEGEDIRPHLLSCDALEALLAAGELRNGPMVMLALWLARLRPDLRAGLRSD
jgi:nudix-type nucleoside diphosphatase (YffH/AdpP family)